ncbi:MAG: TolC family protein, partial [Comamonadaceae bacterium]
DLAAATIRVRQAQLLAGIADSRLSPQFSGNVSTGVNRALESGASSNRSNGVSIGASYEVDLWNRLGSQRDVARWEAQATLQDREATALALIGTTAQLYWQLGYLNQRLASSEQSIAYAQKTFDLVQAQYRAGATSGLEFAEAQQSLANQQAARTQLLQQVTEANTALALLFDGPPGQSVTNPQTLPVSTMPVIVAGLPAELLGRRPDLRAAELRVRESFTTIDATRASYYPALNLTASLGSSSAALLSVLQNPVLALGAGISLPFLQRTQMKLDIQVSESQYEEAVVTFRQTLYTALGDVDNALSAREQFARQGELLALALQAARDAERLYEVRYRAGAVPLKSWLDAQEQRRTA